PPTTPLFPYTTLFRSDFEQLDVLVVRSDDHELQHAGGRQVRLDRLNLLRIDFGDDNLDLLGAKRPHHNFLEARWIQSIANDRDEDRKSTRLNSSHLVI